jgi:hypothetical protein
VLTRWRVLEREWCCVAFDDDVHVSDIERVTVFGGQAEGLGESRAGLDQAYPIRIGAGPLKLSHARSGVQRKAHPAVGVGRGTGGADDPWGECLERWFESSEVRRNEFDVCSTRDEETFSRP